MESEISVLQVEKRIRSRVKRQMEKTQREYYLNEQMKAIQKELGELEDGRDEASELEERIRKTKLSKEAREKALAEVKLRSMSPMSAEATVVRYLDWMLSIPWKKRSKISKDLKRAQQILDEDHFGLEKVKERIVEYLAVQQRVDKIKGPILCLVGPPGVGKTSLGKSLARATGRNFVRVSLGGIRDEAEIRGHRRTYIGSMPGKIIQSMKKAKTSNPLFMLDELDKMGADFRGDPRRRCSRSWTRAEQQLQRPYLEVDYDLSDVMFVCTANTLRMPQPLQDRLEIIRLAGYTEDEKIEIARRHLIPKQLEAHGIKPEEWSLSADGLIDLIRYYARSRRAQSRARDRQPDPQGDQEDLARGQEAGPGHAAQSSPPTPACASSATARPSTRTWSASAPGLAWTEVGGELLSIEAVTVPGKGRMTITGKLGDVMQESVQAAKSYVRSRSTALGIIPADLRQARHPHPRARGRDAQGRPLGGVAMVSSIVSVLTKIPVKASLAMTGEITLRGPVLPIGGLKEKLLAALRGGIKTVLIPKENEKDLAEIPDNVKKALQIVPVAMVDEVLRRALLRQPEPVEWTEVEPERMPAPLPRAAPSRRRPCPTNQLSEKPEKPSPSRRGGSAKKLRFPASEPLTIGCARITLHRLPGDCSSTLYHCHGGCTVNKNDLIAAVADKSVCPGPTSAGLLTPRWIQLPRLEEERRCSAGRLRHLSVARRAASAGRNPRTGQRDSCIEAGAVQGRQGAQGRFERRLEAYPRPQGWCRRRRLRTSDTGGVNAVLYP